MSKVDMKADLCNIRQWDLRLAIELDRIDLVVLDLGLPDGDGVDFIRDLRAWSACALIVLSARSEETDWRRIVALYDALDQLAPSPVVRLNRAVAVAEAYGPASALELVDALRTDPALQHYHLLPAVRGDDGALDLQIDGTCCAKRAMRNAAGGCES